MFEICSLRRENECEFSALVGQYPTHILGFRNKTPDKVEGGGVENLELK